MGRMIFLHRHETSDKFFSDVLFALVNSAEGSCANLYTEGASVSKCEAMVKSSSFGSFSIIQEAKKSAVGFVMMVGSFSRN